MRGSVGNPRLPHALTHYNIMEHAACDTGCSGQAKRKPRVYDSFPISIPHNKAQVEGEASQK